MEYQHLSRIVSLYPNTAVSRFACYKIRKGLISEGLAIDEEIVYSLLICRKCSTKLEPGINCKVSIGGKKKKFQNSAVYSCDLCKNNTKFGGVQRIKGLKGPKPKNKENTVVAKLDCVKLEEIYKEKPMRTLSKEGKKKSLLDSFFESTQEKSLYKIFL